jgi:hypothetical protein
MSATGRGRQREKEDYYTTPSWAVRRLLEAWTPTPSGTLVEPAAGNGAIIRAMAAAPAAIAISRWRAFEIRDEERETLSALCPTVIGDFLPRPGADLVEPDPLVTAWIGNPPFSLAFDFIVECMRRFPCAYGVFLLRLAFAASAERCAFMRANPPDVLALPDRISFDGEGGDSTDYGWFVFHPVAERGAGLFRVLNTTPLAERKLDKGHRVLIEPAQREMFG